LSGTSNDFARDTNTPVLGIISIKILAGPPIRIISWCLLVNTTDRIAPGHSVCWTAMASLVVALKVCSSHCGVGFVDEGGELFAREKFASKLAQEHGARLSLLYSIVFSAVCGDIRLIQLVVTTRRQFETWLPECWHTLANRMFGVEHLWVDIRHLLPTSPWTQRGIEDAKAAPPE
jgi:hypothetical protein